MARALARHIRMVLEYVLAVLLDPPLFQRHQDAIRHRRRQILHFI